VPQAHVSDNGRQGRVCLRRIFRPWLPSSIAGRSCSLKPRREASELSLTPLSP
jgi:hypothetical protein